MKSQNFEFLRSKWPELAGLAGFAEAYAHSDPVGALSKLRMFCEQVVEWIHYELRLSKPFQASLNDLMSNSPFLDVTPAIVLSKLHALRREGNKSLHGNKGDTETAPEADSRGSQYQSMVARHLCERQSRRLSYVSGTIERWC